MCRGRPPVIPPRRAAKHSPLKASPHPDPSSNVAPAGARGPRHPLSLGPASTLPRCPRAGLAPVWQARPHCSPTATPASLPLKPETPDLLWAPIPRLPCEAPPSELSAPCAAGLWPPEHEFSQSRAPARDLQLVPQPRQHGPRVKWTWKRPGLESHHHAPTGRPGIERVRWP